MKRSFRSTRLQITINRSLGVSIERQVYSSIRQSIRNGTLRAGTRIPATRILAKDLGVSRKVVVKAFERLTTEGYLQSRNGAGTYVLPGRVVAPPPMPQEDCKLSKEANRCSEVPAPLRQAPFALDAAADDEFPGYVWARHLTNRWRTLPNGVRSDEELQGLQILREAIAEHIATVREISCDPAEIVVTASRRLALAATLRTLVDPGEKVLIEDPSAPETPEILGAIGANAIRAGVDGEGLKLEAFHEADPSLAVVAATGHFPSGTVMSLGRRYQLCQWAKRLNIPLLEVDHAGGIPLGGPTAGLKAIDTRQRVIFIGSLGAVMPQGLGAGYVIAPPWLASAIARIAATDRAPASYAQQAALADFIRQGDFSRHVQRLEAVYVERREMLRNELRSQLHGAVRAVIDGGATHLIAWLADDIDDLAVERRALQRGLSVRALTSFGTRGDLASALVLGCGAMPVETIRESVAALASVVDTLSRDPRHADREAGPVSTYEKLAGNGANRQIDGNPIF